VGSRGRTLTVWQAWTELTGRLFGHVRRLETSTASSLVVHGGTCVVIEHYERLSEVGTRPVGA